MNHNTWFKSFVLMIIGDVLQTIIMITVLLGMEEKNWKNQVFLIEINELKDIYKLIKNT